MTNTEQQARELLAAEYTDDGCSTLSAFILFGDFADYPDFRRAIRAIKASLERTHNPELDDERNIMNEALPGLADARKALDALSTSPEKVAPVAEIAGDVAERVADAILNARDDDGELIAWSVNFWSRQRAALFFAQAALSTIQPPAIEGWEERTCLHCDGEGDIDDGDHACFTCGGTGKVKAPRSTPSPLNGDVVERAARAIRRAQQAAMGDANEKHAPLSMDELDRVAARAALSSLSSGEGSGDD